MKNKLTILALFTLVSFSVIFAQTKTAPVNSLTGVSIQPVFIWTNLTQATFDIAYSSSLGGLVTGYNVIDASTAVESGSYTYTFNCPERANNLLNNTTYYWNVIPHGQANTVNVSSGAFSFTTTTSAVASLISPVTDANVPTYTPVLFSWSLNSPVGSLTFKLQYVKNSAAVGTPDATDWANSGITTPVNCGSNVSNYTQDLTPGTKYWWRVITYRGTDIVSYSSQRYFTTGGGAVVSKAIPSWPTGGTTVPTNAPTLYWYTLNPDLLGITFEIVIGTDSTGTVVQTHSGITDLSHPVSPDLLPGTTYFWKIITYGTGDVTSSTSYWKSFKTNGTGTVVQPNASYPLNGMTVYSQSPTFRWYLNAPASGITYNVYIDGTNNALDVVTDQWSLQTVRTLLPGAHTWYVKATNGTPAQDLSSSTINFTVDGGISVGLPVAYWPVGNSSPIIYTTTPTLSWYMTGSSLGLQNYTVAWNIANLGTGGAWSGLTTKYNTADMTERSYTLLPTEALDFGQEYWWAVASYDGSAYSAWSIGHFTLAGTTGSIVPVVLYPTGGGTIYSTSATLSWYLTGSTIGIDHYQVIWSRRADFNGDVDDNSTTFVRTTANQSYSATSLQPGATYYWKVLSHNGTAPSAYSSPIGTFVVAATANSNVIVPLVGGPSNNVSIATTSPMISWVIPTQAIAPLKYDLQYSTKQDMSNATTVSGINNPSQVVSGLSTSQEYYWRVCSKNDKGEASSYSEVARFVVNATTAIEDQVVLPTAFALSQNYPNPFNPTTQISYALPQNSYVSIKVYDMLGREVKTLLNNEVLAGNHSVTWNGDDNSGMKVVSGVYLYKINAGDFVKTMKLILMK